MCYRFHHQRRDRQPSCLRATGNWQLATLRAFTLIELLIVLAIISLVVALGIPLFGVLTGARSVEAGRNVVAAVIGQARTIAVNEGKYAGVMFYVDPASERTMMSIVVPEDQEPYNKYMTWIAGEQYEGDGVDATTKQPVRAERVISMAADADATYRGDLYNKNPLVSNYLNYFGNYRPATKAFRAVKADFSNDRPNNRPPRNGPYGTYSGSSPVPQQYVTIPTPAASTPPSSESDSGPLTNDNWTPDNTGLIRYRVDDQPLPIGVGVQVIVQPIVTGAAAGSPSERYVRTGLVMFDSQGRLVTNQGLIDDKKDLGKTLLLTDPARKIYAGVGIVLYDDQAFRGQGFSQADWAYSPRTAGNVAAINVGSANTALRDYPKPDAPNVNAAFTVSEYTEEQWLDNNATPLLINRYSGSLSEAD